MSKAFISYATADKKVAGEVKRTLEKYDIKAFLAHEDINVSQNWKNRIISELKDCDIFIPLLSAAFRESDWAQQEIGFAFSLDEDDLLIIPLSLDGTIPFGFINHIQGKPLASNGVIDTDLLVDPIAERFPREIIPALIDDMADSGGFRTAETRMLRLMPLLDKFENNEIDEFAKAVIGNGQILYANLCRKEYIPEFLQMHEDRLDSATYTALSDLIAPD